MPTPCFCAVCKHSKWEIPPSGTFCSLPEGGIECSLRYLFHTVIGDDVIFVCLCRCLSVIIQERLMSGTAFYKQLTLDFDIFVILQMKSCFNMSPFTISHCYLISRCKDLLFLRLNVTKCLWEIRTGDIYLCLGISLQ